MIPLNPCSLSNVIVAIPAVVLVNEVETPEILRPTPKSLTNWSVASLVILFFRSLVETSPRGLLFANVFADLGLSSILSLSSCGYKSTTF